jgi:hypothetical protein
MCATEFTIQTMCKPIKCLRIFPFQATLNDSPKRQAKLIGSAYADNSINGKKYLIILSNYSKFWQGKNQLLLLELHDGISFKITHVDFFALSYYIRMLFAHQPANM